ncbi:MULTISPECIES: hypothetical protein [Sphingobium]|uniref:hypothetical protein n=1 Tax=Sphingobium TaxID=165695 RepID=UPI0013ED918C|nr:MULTISPECIES: hypothetical protein [Sphingobium]
MATLAGGTEGRNRSFHDPERAQHETIGGRAAILAFRRAPATVKTGLLNAL